MRPDEYSIAFELPAEQASHSGDCSGSVVTPLVRLNAACPSQHDRAHRVSRTEVALCSSPGRCAVLHSAGSGVARWRLGGADTERVLACRPERRTVDIGREVRESWA